MDLQKTDNYVPQYPNIPSFITNLIHIPSGIYPLTGRKLYSDDKKCLYDKLKVHNTWSSLTPLQKKLAKRYIRKYVKIIIYEFEEVEKAIKYALYISSKN